MVPISAIVVNYNAGDWLTRCVSSLLAEQVDEVIVVDNCSVDGSMAALGQRFRAEVESGQIKPLPQTNNLGFSKACNKGSAMARNPYLLFLNPDSVAHSGSLETLLNTLRKHPSFGLIGGKVFNTDGTEQAQSNRAFPSLGLFKAKTLGQGVSSPQNTFADINPVQAISGSCMLISKALYEEIGGFDERYALHCEDLDLCVKIHQHGLQVGYVDAAHFTHAKGVCSTTNPVWVERQKHQSMARFYLKHLGRLYKPVDLLVVIPGLITHMAWVWIKIKLKL